MKAITLNKSWHFRAANYGTTRVYADEGTDICSYTRAVLAGSFWFSVVAFSLGALAILAGASFWNLFTVLFFGAEFAEYAIAFFAILGMLGAIFGIALFKDWWDRRPIKDAPETPPTFAGLAYRKFKDKTCFRINFNE